MPMLISKTLFTFFHRIVHEKELSTRLRKKTEGPPNSSERAAYKVNKLNALFMFPIHFIRCGQVFAFKTRARHSMNQNRKMSPSQTHY